MSESFPTVECSIETLDRTLYASREVGELVDTGDYILSTALYYAFGFVSGKYINFGNKPNYIEETSGIYKKFYITPAKPESVAEYVSKILGVPAPKGKAKPTVPRNKSPSFAMLSTELGLRQRDIRDTLKYI